jgi:hypothetical protein
MWRQKEASRLDHDRAYAAFLFTGIDGAGFQAGYDALVRWKWARWSLAIFCFLGGVAVLVVPFLRDPADRIHPSEMGWMGWGVAGLVLFIGLWLAALPYAGTRIGRALRWTALAAAAAPVVAHVVGVL